MVLSSRFPQCIVWGPQLITLYNDAFRPILGDKPEALGRPFSAVWAEAWDIIGPIAGKAYAGEATFIEDFPLTVDRRGFGSRLIESVLAEDFGGRVRLSYEPDGLCCELTARMSNPRSGA